MAAKQETFVCPYNKEVDCDHANCQKMRMVSPGSQEKKGRNHE